MTLINVNVSSQSVKIFVVTAWKRVTNIVFEVKRSFDFHRRKCHSGLERHEGK